MRPFGCPITILNTIDHLGKFDGKADEDFFVGYSLNSKAFRVFNSRTRIVEENLHIRFSESPPNIVGSRPNWLFNIDALTRTMNYEPIVAGTQSNGFIDPKSSHDDGSKPSSNDGKKINKDPRKESEFNNQENEDNVNSTNNVNVASTNEVNAVGGKTSIELPFDPNMPALEDDGIFDFHCDYEDDGAMADMNNLDTTIQVSHILTIRIHKDHPLDQVIGDLHSATQIRKMLKNLEEHGIEAIRLFLAYASFKDFVVYQMDVKSAFLYGEIKEEVYVCQPLGFEDPNFPDKVYKVEKALYGLHQAPKAWYETLSTYLLDNGFQRGKIDKTLFIKRYKGDIFLVQVYVDDIIFGSTKKELCIAFKKLIHKKFQMSSMGELTIFMGLQVQQKKDGIFISQDKYIDEILKNFGLMIGSLIDLTSSRPDIMFAVCACARYQVNPKVSHLYTMKRIFGYLKGQLKLGLWYLKDSLFDLVAYTDSDYARASLDKKSTTGDGKKLIITESIDRRDLQLEDDEGKGFSGRVTPLFLTMLIQNQSELGEGSAMPIDPHHTPTILQPSSQPKKIQKPRKPKRKDTQVPQPSDPSENVADEAVYKKLGDSLVRAATTASSLEAELDSGNITKTRSKATPNESSSLGTTSGGGPGYQETIGDTIAQTRVLDLEKTKTTQGNEIASLKRRVKKLEKKRSSRTHKLKRLYKVDEDITVVDVQDDADKEMFDMDALNGEEVFVAGQNENVVEEVVDAAQVSTAATTVTITIEELTLAQALEALKTSKPKVKWIVFQEPGKSTTTTTISSQQSQDKGKGIMIEEPVKPMKKKVQIMLDEEVALKLQAEFDEEERLAREKAEKEKEANIALIEEWDDIQAKIDVDYQLAERLQAQEQEELSDAEKATLFQQLLEKRRKHFAAKRAEEKRNKPPTKAQQRKIMCTYLKNMEGYKLKDLNLKDFDSIQEMFDRAFKRVNTFGYFRTELVEGREKRAGAELAQEITKKQKVEDDKETAKLKRCLEITPVKEEVIIDVVPLAVKSPSIVGWKIHKEGRKIYYQIIMEAVMTPVEYIP
ncbi:putative ribonuclease H-like domain-containing protein [Tanacetum coccineum]